MSKSDIIAQLPKLDSRERSEILDEAFRSGPRPDEKAMLDRELSDYECSRNAGTPWNEVQARLMKQH